MTPALPPLDPELAAVLAGFPDGVDPGAHLRDMNVVRMLRSTLDLLGVMGASLPTDERVAVEDGAIPGVDAGTEIPVRIYAPVDRDNRAPALVFFHGGAFVLGDRYTEELRCLRYAAEAQCVVVSVDYRLAPEHPYPAGVDDCYAGLEWTVAHTEELDIDPARVGVGGSSAGGALAAAVALDGPGPGWAGARGPDPQLPGHRRPDADAVHARLRRHPDVDEWRRCRHVAALPGRSRQAR